MESVARPGGPALKDAFEFYSEPGLKAYTETKNGETEYFVEGYISTHEKDLVNDIVTQSCMDDMHKQLKNRNIKIDYQHEAWRGESEFEKELNKTITPVARIVNQERDNKGIKAKVKLNKAHNRFEEIWGSIQDEMLDAFSIAFLPEDWDMVTDRDGEEVRMLNKVKLLNVAFTGNPINPDAKMTDVMTKALDSYQEIKDKGTNGLKYTRASNRLKSIKGQIEKLEDELKMAQNNQTDTKDVPDSLEELTKDMDEETAAQVKSFVENTRNSENNKNPEGKGDNMGDDSTPDDKSGNDQPDSPDQKSGGDNNQDVKSQLEDLKSRMEDLESSVDSKDDTDTDTDTKDDNGDGDGTDTKDASDEIKELKSQIDSLKENLEQPNRKSREVDFDDIKSEVEEKDGDGGPLDYIG